MSSDLFELFFLIVFLVSLYSTHPVLRRFLQLRPNKAHLLLFLSYQTANNFISNLNGLRIAFVFYATRLNDIFEILYTQSACMITPVIR